MLTPQVMFFILRTREPIQVDLFASPLKHVPASLLFRSPGSQSMGRGRLPYQLEGDSGFCLSPIFLIPRPLQKVIGDQVSVLLGVPYWPRIPSFLEFMKLLAGLPILLPVRPDLVVQPLSGFRYPCLTTLHLPLGNYRVISSKFRPSNRAAELTADSHTKLL